MVIFLLLMIISFLWVVNSNLCKLVAGVNRLVLVAQETKRHVAGDPDDFDSIMIKPSVKELIADEGMKIQCEISMLRNTMQGQK